MTAQPLTEEERKRGDFPLPDPVKAPPGPALAPKPKPKSDFELRKEVELVEAMERKTAADAYIKARDAAFKKG